LTKASSDRSDVSCWIVKFLLVIDIAVTPGSNADH
jgi:hypothetical protein